MEFFDEPLPGALRVRLKRLPDARGCFVKTYSHSVFTAAGVDFDCREEYYSISKKDTVRGMHFQLPPHDHAKIGYCAAGAVEDVLVDLRSGPGYGKFCSFLLSADEPSLIIIPKGLAHGFKSLTDGSIMVYKASSEYAPQHDTGICWDSFGFNWDLDSPVISDRDRKHPSLSEFVTPF